MIRHWGKRMPLANCSRNLHAASALLDVITRHQVSPSREAEGRKRETPWKLPSSPLSRRTLYRVKTLTRARESPPRTVYTNEMMRWGGTELDDGKMALWCSGISWSVVLINQWLDIHLTLFICRTEIIWEQNDAAIFYFFIIFSYLSGRVLLCGLLNECQLPTFLRRYALEVGERDPVTKCRLGKCLSSFKLRWKFDWYSYANPADNSTLYPFSVITQNIYNTIKNQ